ncbi:Gly_transf_sug domain-containing protein/Gb3_synth domain-containing protein [Cephalotus follicularis]|uniref:Gly_transf_sug domain-containing protein/Gb3_synth domain-containing protein n=1 Tax=Cephalotus follicularis TaxID=3775 RepID=A0A1Q3D303_CEPFO|nr:Gly_transf_sug domain-containing protein/Gb3_synth domain-containing protein [Cephalotus follicularis]
MLRSLRSRRRSRYGAHVCAVISALVLLLLSVSLLHTRLSQPQLLHHQRDAVSQTHHHPLLSDDQDISFSSFRDEDLIDELDVVDEDQQNDNEEPEEDDPQQQENDNAFDFKLSSSSGYFFDHLFGSIRRVFNKRSIDNWDYDYAASFSGVVNLDDKVKTVFGSDDIPVDEEVRRKVGEVVGVEDALLLKVGKRVSPLREKWGDWFDKKSDFLRKDKMFKSNLEALNPLNNPMLQDPDGVGVTGLTRGDRLVQKWLFNEFKKVPPFLDKKPLGISHEDLERKGKGRSEIKMVERRTLDDANDGVTNGLFSKRVNDANEDLSSSRDGNLDKKIDRSNELDSKNANNSSKDFSSRANAFLSDDSSRSRKTMQASSIGEELGRLDGMKGMDSEAQTTSEFSDHIYADGKRWGYYPGLHPHLSFLDFMDAFFRKGKCDVRVFMVWNSPPWMYGVRHQRGLESLLSHHGDACVVVFSETIDLDFFKDTFVKDGYKVAVVMPNLDELLKDTPTHVFASVWFEWRKTKFYSTHYSELVRLAALYKYGGIYLDSDIVVLKGLSLLCNTIGLETHLAGRSLNGAVMAFDMQSPFIMDCLKEFYLTYDDTRLRWNGADLLTRVARNFLWKKNRSSRQLELKVQPSFVFFPISSQNITRYFVTPASAIEKAQQDALFTRILDESLTFHFWNSLTSTLIPEPDSLVSRLIDHPCIRCFDVL